MNIHKLIASMGITAGITFVCSLAFFHVYLLPNELNMSQNLVKLISSDIASSHRVGAVNVIDKCKEDGSVFIPGTEGSPGMLIDCKNIEVKNISDPLSMQQYTKNTQSLK